MTLNRTLRSPACCNFASANKQANSAVIKKLVCSQTVLVISVTLDILPLHWQFGTKTLGETFDNIDILDDSAFC